MAEPARIGIAEYFRKPESLRRMELVYGMVREPPAPRYGHQSVVTRLTALLDTHVRAQGLGAVCVSPIDVVLDVDAALIVQPDIIFVAAARLEIVRSRIWGAPDLTIEVLSPRTAVRDRTTKLRWYREYGVRECWLVDPRTHAIEVRSREASRERPRVYGGGAPMRSAVLPDWEASADDVFT